jgi:hypothetical protein
MFSVRKLAGETRVSVTAELTDGMKATLLAVYGWSWNSTPGLMWLAIGVFPAGRPVPCSAELPKPCS